MPEYLSPGVYVEELPGPRAIEGVSTSTAGFVGQTERGPGTPRLVTSWLDYQRWFGGFIPTDVSFLPFAVKGFFDNGGQRLFIARVHADDAVPAGGTVGNLQLRATGDGAWGNRIFVRVNRPNLPEDAPPETSRFRLTLLYYSQDPPEPFVDPFDRAQIRNPNRVEPDATEIYNDVGHVEREGNYVLNVLRNSKLVIPNWAEGAAPAAPANTGGYIRLEGGVDGGAVGLEQYRGDGAAPVNERTGLAGLAGIDEISLLCVPDHNRINNLDSEIVIQCEQLKDRFAVLQIDAGQGDVGDLRYPQDSTYAAVYYPWIRVVNPLTEQLELIPPGGHVTGIIARTDIERGVHKAPANEVVRGIVAAGQNGTGPLEFYLSKGEHDMLNPRGINVIRDFRVDGRGVRVWGARTISSDPAWKYVNVRRLFLFVEESIDEGTQWVVFEPNSEPTWAAVRRTITGFLTSVWRSGALMGTTAEEAFFVKCDRTTMTQDDIDNGRLICYIGIAPVKPAEFVIFRISQLTAESES
jgi:phage tail sheath protein FI